MPYRHLKAYGRYAIPLARAAYRGYRSSRRPSRRVRKARVPRTRSSRLPKKVTGLTKQVRELKRLAKADMGTHIHRIRMVDTIKASENNQQYSHLFANNVAILQDVLSRLKYYDPSNPTALLTADGDSGSFQKEFYFSKVHSKIVVRNNYQVPCEVRVYSLTIKDDTSVNPTQVYEDGLVDMGSPSPTSPLLFLTDSKVFRDTYHILKSKVVHLDAGKECTMSWTAKPFSFDPATFDVHNRQYQTAYKAMAWMVFVRGTVAHDALGSDTGTSSAGVDMLVDVVLEVQYPAGADITQISVDNQSDVFSNGALITNKPMADNQPFTSA